MTEEFDAPFEDDMTKLNRESFWREIACRATSGRNSASASVKIADLMLAAFDQRFRQDETLPKNESLWHELQAAHCRDDVFKIREYWINERAGTDEAQQRVELDVAKRLEELSRFQSIQS